MRRRLAALGLLPLLLLGSATPATAAGRTPAEPGFTVKKVEHVVKYGVISWDPESGDLLDAGTVRLDYTCRPGGLWHETATVFLYVSTGAGGFSTVRFGEDVPCDGARHKVDLAVGRLTAAPWDPGVKLARGQSSILVLSCLFCESTAAVELGPLPQKVRYRGDWPQLASL